MILRHEIDWCDPFTLASRVADRPGFAFLDSALFHPTLGRYSYIGIEPFGLLTASRAGVNWNGMRVARPALAVLRDLLARYNIAAEPGLPPFQGGVIGAVPYEFGWQLDGLADGNAQHPWEAPLHLGFYDLVIAFDQQQRRSFILSSGLPMEDITARKHHAAARRDRLLAVLEEARPVEQDSRPAQLRWTSNFTQASYCTAIERVREHILDGDVYQANVAQRFACDLPADFSSFALYAQLRQQNPAPFAAYLTCGATVIASSSPELLVRKRGNRLETRPIKGTAPRSDHAEQDAHNAQVLLASDKDRAENIMIVDLLRNDLSRVCRPFSVAVPVSCGLESYANVHHLVSVVTGELAAGRDVVDVIAALFPGGSITGAPKRRAMEIIETIERAPRDYYCGSVVAIGFDGTLDMNIAIRTAMLGNGRAVIHGGGGITCLSDPMSEYAETLAKINRLFSAFGKASQSGAASS